jgi:hypothetical protein
VLFGGVDDIGRQRIPGLYDNDAWKITNAGGYLYLYRSESGISWMLPSTGAGSFNPTSFKLLAGMAIDKLLNEIAWIERGRPEFKSRDNPDGWDYAAHHSVEHEDEIPY